MRRAVFLDRDGTIIEAEGYLRDPSRARLLPGVLDALRTFRDLGMMLVVVSNQSGIPRGLITPVQHAAVDARVKQMLADEGVPLDAVYYCAHLPDGGCPCRKPLPGMLERAAREHAIELPRSFMVGDKMSDVAAGHAAGCVTALIGDAKVPWLTGHALPKVAQDASTAPSDSPQPDHRAADWPSLLSSMEASWKS